MMAYYATYGNTSEEFQAEMAARRRMADVVKLIEGSHQTVITNLWTWYRHHEWAKKHDRPVPESAHAAMSALIAAKAEEDRLWDLLFGMEQEQRAIEGKHG
jgi:hypothetical protein